VHNVAKRDGGLQRIEIGDTIVNLDFTDSEKLLTFKIRKPTPAELNDTPSELVNPKDPI
jgi:hypothetical protein